MTDYTVELTEKAEADVERAYLWTGRTSPGMAERWHVGFVAKLASLSAMPSRCPVARENDSFPDVTVRQLLYGKYRILFHVIEAQDQGAQGTVRVLHVLHGAQSPVPPAENGETE